MYENLWTSEFLFSFKNDTNCIKLIEKAWKFLNLWISLELIQNDIKCIQMFKKFLRVPMNFYEKWYKIDAKIKSCK